MTHSIKVYDDTVTIRARNKQAGHYVACVYGKNQNMKHERLEYYKNPSCPITSEYNRYARLLA